MNNSEFLIIVNPHCHQGKGLKRWNSVKKMVLGSLPPSANEIILTDSLETTPYISTFLQLSSNKFIISAGGDGSMHNLINFLFSSPSIDISKITIGAVGLGSSNDFLKPFKNKMNNIPVLINYSGTFVNHDIGKANYLDENKFSKIRYFVVNASIGVTANANWYFNNPDKILKVLKAHSTGTAILYTAITTILKHKNITCKIGFNETEMKASISNINILKKRNVSGSLWYNQNITPDSGQLNLNICRDMNKLDLLNVLSQLGKGKFDLGNKTITEIVNTCFISSENPFVFECDGETELANNVDISVIPKAINILNS